MICKPCQTAADKPNTANAGHPGCVDKVVSYAEDVDASGQEIWSFRPVDHLYRSCDCQHKRCAELVTDVPLQGTGE